MYNHSSIDEIDLNQIWKLLLQTCNSTKMRIANSVSLSPNTNCFTCRKHYGNSVIDYVLLFEGTLQSIHNFSQHHHTWAKLRESQNPKMGRNEQGLLLISSQTVVTQGWDIPWQRPFWDWACVLVGTEYGHHNVCVCMCRIE